ncbi:MAG: MerR family transcriptional regulator [Bacteroidota bacterium]
MPAEGIRKLYYSIGEVSQITGLEQHVLRYWETEFLELNPQKNRAGRRIYTRSDIDFISRIKQLLKEEKYTIEGARKALVQADENRGKEEALRTELLAIRNFLSDILSRL